jgi:prepilin-type processing-associated H-X9-DG protein
MKELVCVNDGYFMNILEDNLWANLPGSYHNGAANLCYADGHVEGHRWVVADTTPPARPNVVRGQRFAPSAPTHFNWLKERTSFKQTQ